jgi:APA family basic amino acid/polyamine antiporter
MSDATIGKPSATKSVFLRPSSGLVRAFTWWDGLIYNIYAISVVAACTLIFSLTFVFPGANLPLGIVIACLAFVPGCVVYAMLTTVMPRAGGDYVWQSRILGGFWGFWFVFFPLAIGATIFIVSNVLPGAVAFISPLAHVVGNLTGITALEDFGNWIATSAGQFWFFVVFLAWAAFVVGSGMRFYAQVQRYLFIIGMIGLITWLVGMLITSRETFTSNFNFILSNQYHWGTADAYSKVLSDAKKAGFGAVSLSQTNLGDTLLIGPILAYIFAGVFWVGNLSGEIGGVRQFRLSMRIYVGAILSAMVICGLLALLMINMVGNEFYTSAAYQWWAGGGSSYIPVAPWLTLFLMSISQSPIWWIWVLLTFGCWFMIWPTNNIVGGTRYAFAMAFDRILPARIASVTGKNSPIFAIGVYVVISLVMGWLYFFGNLASIILDQAILLTAGFAVTILAGTLFPYLPATRQRYFDSPIGKYKVAGLPLISVMGVLSLIYFAFLLGEYAFNPTYGTNNVSSAEFLAGGMVVSAILYFGMRALRKRQGVNMKQIYQEVPEE